MSFRSVPVAAVEDLQVSLVHAAFILRNGGIKVVISAMVEVSSSCARLNPILNVSMPIGLSVPYSRQRAR
jgi:hypothetical protein